MITGAVPVVPYSRFRNTLGSPFPGRFRAAIPPPAALLDGPGSVYYSPSAVSHIIALAAAIVNPFLRIFLKMSVLSGNADVLNFPQ